MQLDDIVERAGRAERLDPIAERASHAVKQLIRQGAVKDILSGTWLGHPAHPPLTDIPIGSFTSATVLDLIGGDRSWSAANTLVAIGRVDLRLPRSPRDRAGAAASLVLLHAPARSPHRRLRPAAPEA